MPRKLLWAGLLAAVTPLAGCAERPVPSRAVLPTTVPAPSQSETLALLTSQKFGELDRRFSAIQRAFDHGTITDEALRAGFRVFYSPDPKLEVLYQAWVTRFPRSYVAHLARGIYYVHVGDLVLTPT